MNQPRQGYHSQGGGGARPQGQPNQSGPRDNRNIGSNNDPGLPESLLAKIKFGDGKIIDPKLFWEVAEEIANAIGNQESDKEDKKTQIRKFYDEVILYKDRIGNNQEEFKNKLPFIKMIYAKVSYSKGRKIISSRFDSFMKTSLQQVNTLEQFKVFVAFFEAFMGFYRSTKLGGK